jgi:hypothetical protein
VIAAEKEAIATESVEEKGLHIEKPERAEEHHKHSHRQESTGTLIPKGSKVANVNTAK